ncbi:hypothetical protein [Paenibacillus agricola]|uniref:Uncharacterized protein n=1 Tax=Paenibacillus agricola TaxID=2716264 RepID=A0ABX0JB89_9BACL|nr:hypothetical protein [Paenibacillus agricola]NHN31211.1 hypothetical protein [Paenibacillus agricola]
MSPSELNELVLLMKVAREKSNIANTMAYELRQRAIQYQFEATAATETAALIIEILASCTDSALLPKIMFESKEAALKAVSSILKASKAVEEANKEEKEVTASFNLAYEAASKLVSALSYTEDSINMNNNNC